MSLAREVGLPSSTRHTAWSRRRRSSRARRGAGAGSRGEGVHRGGERTTLAAWQDIWRSTHSDFFANAPIAIVATRSSGRAWNTIWATSGVPIALVHRGRARRALRAKSSGGAQSASPSPDGGFRLGQRADDHRSGEASVPLHRGIVSGSNRPPSHRHAAHRLHRRGVAASTRLRRALRHAVRQFPHLLRAAQRARFRRPICCGTPQNRHLFGQRAKRRDRVDGRSQSALRTNRQAGSVLRAGFRDEKIAGGSRETRPGTSGTVDRRSSKK